MTTRTDLGLGNRVVSLINHENGEWRTTLVQHTFLPHEAEEILSIPLSPLNLDDSLVWAKTPNGCFTVKSAYRAAVKCLTEAKGDEEAPECLDNSRMTTIWRTIWDLKCPNKIKHLLWRACRGILPTKKCLMHRKIMKDDCCDIFGESETSSHCLWSCILAKETWRGLGFNIDNSVPSPVEFLDVFWQLLESQGDKDWEFFAIVAWCLWNNRNSVWHRGVSKQGKTIKDDARRYWEEVRTALSPKG